MRDEAGQTMQTPPSPQASVFAPDIENIPEPEEAADEEIDDLPGKKPRLRFEDSLIVSIEDDGTQEHVVSEVTRSPLLSEISLVDFIDTGHLQPHWTE